MTHILQTFLELKMHSSMKILKTLLLEDKVKSLIELKLVN